MATHGLQPPRPNYDWVLKNGEQSFDRQFQEQYSKFCKERGIEWDGQPFYEYNKFTYTPPPENLSLSRNSQQSCSPLLAGSVRQAPKVPLETEWKSVTEYVPRAPPS